MAHLRHPKVAAANNGCVMSLPESFINQRVVELGQRCAWRQRRRRIQLEIPTAELPTAANRSLPFAAVAGEPHRDSEVII